MVKKQNKEPIQPKCSRRHYVLLTALIITWYINPQQKKILQHKEETGLWMFYLNVKQIECTVFHKGRGYLFILLPGIMIL